jgi:chromosome segregation ATPase
MSELRRDREWEHWPSERRPEEGIRRKLRELFHPTGTEEELELALTEQSNEIELRARELAETVADLERREARTYELRTTVEQMLRRGSAELDERHAELSDLAARLAEREEAVAEAEEALAERRRELGAVELRRAALERRQDTLAELEAQLERREQTLAEREQALAGLEEQQRELARRESELASRGSEVESLQARVSDTLAVVEREQQALAEREASLREREERLRDLEAREQELDSTVVDLDARAHALESERSEVETQREELKQAVASLSRDLGLASAPPEDTTARYVALVPGDRYRLAERDDGPVAIGDLLALDGETYRIVRVGSSPLPADRRRCAFLERVPPEPRA